MNESKTSTSAPNGAPVESLEWQFLQCFGERSPGEEIQEADIISAVEFDPLGQHLATGDRGGRVVLFERVYPHIRHAGIEQRQTAQQRTVAFEYRYLTEFQSHEPEFDYLKSQEIEEKINKVRWCKSSAGSRMLLSTNDKTIKLWKVFDKRVVSLTEYNGAQSLSSHLPGVPNGVMPNGQAHMNSGVNGKLKVPKVAAVSNQLTSKCRRAYQNAHTYHINSISVNSDQETFLSADDLRINLWHLDVTDQSFNVVDIKPSQMEDLTEVITVAEFHPWHCHIFAYSTSKGAIRLADMREAALCDKHAKIFEEPDTQRTFFSEIISTISDIKFSRCGRYMCSRDYMTMKLWDLHKEDKPVAVYNVQEPLRARLCDLYENDSIFDKFDCCMSGNATGFATGTYSNFFKVFHQQQPQPAAATEILMEATRDPLRKRSPLRNERTPNRFTARPAARRSVGNEEELLTADFTAKLLHLSWHPEANVIAAAASNSLYLYCAS